MIERRVDPRSLVAFRVLFGAIMAFGAVRMLATGWIDPLFVEPSFYFKYPGFSWVQPLTRDGMYALYASLAVLATCIALGAFYRAATLLFTLGFAYAQLIDVTNYLNHYYLVVLLGFELTLVPAHAAYSVDAWRKPELRRRSVPAIALWLLRFQLAVVYVFAGLAKLQADWLLQAQPLKVWFAARDELPLIGWLLRQEATAYAASWAAFLYDTTIPLWLSWRKSRALAFCAVLSFHALTFIFFDIGLFPFIMTAGATLFFAPDWPKRLLKAPPGAIASSPSRHWLTAFAIFACVQVVVPLRHYAYGADVIWDEEGMRFSWKVMVREKNGSISYRVRSPSRGRTWIVSPHDYLTWRQANEMSGQPDLIAQLAEHIAHDFAARGIEDVEVFTDAWVSLNGKKLARLIDPGVNLLHIDRPWLLPRR